MTCGVLVSRVSGLCPDLAIRKVYLKPGKTQDPFKEGCSGCKPQTSDTHQVECTNKSLGQEFCVCVCVYVCVCVCVV